MKLPIAFLLIAFSYFDAQIFSPKTILNYLKPKVSGFIDTSINGTACAADLKMFVHDLYKLELWALNMFDASSKLHPGILKGNMRLYGNYDQCLSVQHNINGTEISGQYCTVPVVLDEKISRLMYNLAKSVRKGQRFIDWNIFVKYCTVYLGLCIPKSCSVRDLNNLWNHMRKVFKIPASAKFVEETCLYKEKEIESNTIDVYVFWGFFIILVVELASTAYDVYLRQFGKKPDILVSFSLYTNFKKLLSTRCENDSLTCLYGIRVITMMWIIIGHIASYRTLGQNSNSLDIVMEWVTRVENTIFFAAPYAVDTFFSISGLLVIYVQLKYSEKFKISVFMLYFHRLVRLLPALLATILIYVSISKYLTDGPFWPVILKQFKNSCEKSWWVTLLFGNNYKKVSELCIQQSWYLAVDTQLYVVSPLIIFYIKKNASKAFLGIFGLCVCSAIYTMAVVIRNNFGFVIFWEIWEDEALLTYTSTICRMPSWLIGTYFGYLLYKYNSKKIKISKTTNLVLWIISLCTMLSLILYQNVFVNEKHNIFRSAFFNAFSRPLWALAVCFIIFSCATGHGGVVNTFLSLPVFVVLGKLTYSMFLIHLLVIHVVTVNKRHAHYFNNFEIFCDFWSNFVITLFCSTVMCLVFETPVVSLLSHLEKRKNKKVE